MLYKEFLIGTEAPDNAYTYAEYKRIEAIYNNDNRMEKQDAYAMYQKPDKLTENLLLEISTLKEKNADLSWEIKKAKKQIEELKKYEWRYKQLMEEAKNLKKMFMKFSDDFYYHLEDKMGVF